MGPSDQDNLSAGERRRRQAFLTIGSSDLALVQTLKPIFARHAQVFAERFYQHLLSDPHTSQLLTDPKQLERLKKLQVEYFTELLSGTFDENYFASRLRVGHAHQRVGLEPQWYLGAYNQYIQITFPIFAEAFGARLAEAMPSLLALVKVIFLDIGLALDTYFSAATRQLRQRNEDLQHALDLYGRVRRREEEIRRVSNHEIRGGLAAIITGLEDLLDRVQAEPASEDIRSDIARLKDRCWDLSNLLKDMLAASAQGGPAWVDSGTLFAQLQARFGLYTSGRKIRLKLPDQTPRLWADPTQLREIFANLLSNSVRYIVAETGLVEITWQTEGRFVRFGVHDNGPGIPANVQARLFEPFVRGPNAPEGGTGLGLYFVRSMVEQNGGQIGFEPSEMGGAHFWFTVPSGPPAGQ
jgi:signal transduction histidine kinase